jgi:hypothetical protein
MIGVFKWEPYKLEDIILMTYLFTFQLTYDF